jgi:hypothetical protein
MPCLLNVLKEMTPKNDMTIQKSLFALTEFTNNLHEDIKLYLSDVVQLLLNFLTNPSFSKEVRYWALMALGAVESSAEKKILPYQEVILKTLYDTITNPTAGTGEMTVRGQALMCAGQLASAVGKERFPQECINVFTKVALEFLAMDKFELRETAISYFAELVRILKGEMEPIINQVLDEILKSCKSEAGFKEEKETKTKDAFSLDSDSDEGEQLVGMNVDINFIDEKSAAVHALGNMGLFCAGLLLPRLKEIVDILAEIGDYFHENIRYHVCMTYLQIAVGLLRHFTGSEEKFPWVKGLPVKVDIPAGVREYLDSIVFPHYYELFMSEDNKEVIEKTLECVREACEVFGPAALAPHAERIIKDVILPLLDKKAYCQVKGAGGGEGGEKD